MKDYSKYIFDVDYTLLIPDWSNEDIFFRDNLNINNIDELLSDKLEILIKYERSFNNYSYKKLSDYFKEFGYTVSPRFIEDWVEFNGENIIDSVPDGVYELFEYLKSNNKSIVILTNWFSKTQIERLKRHNLYTYIDDLIGGDICLKPSSGAFSLAAGNTPKSDCIMIGDSYTTDILGAKSNGIDYFKIDDNNTILNFYNNIKTSNKKYVKKDN